MTDGIQGAAPAASGSSRRGRVEAPLRLEARNVSKLFGGVHALRDAHLAVAPGEVHGLVGENGSGKSTLIKILAGFHAPEPGAELRMNGREIDLPLKPGEFRDLGLSFVHQHLGLIPSLTVVENLLLTKLSTARGGRLQWRRERELARRTLEGFGLDLDLNARVARLSQVQRASLAIVRAAADLDRRGEDAAGGDAGGGVLILDEPTVFLSEEGLQQLFQLIRDVVRRGASVIFVSHDLDEVLSITDRATVLRDGHVVGTVESAASAKSELVAMIIGHHLEALAAYEKPPTARRAAISASGLAGYGSALAGSGFDVHEGEILGVTGLVGSGFDEIPYLLYGAWPGGGGRLTLAGETHELSSMTPAKALRAGIVLIPGNRQRDGSIATLSVADNVMMQALDRYFRRMWLRGRSMTRDAAELLTRFDVRPNQPHMLYHSLSGGNQQKVVLAKWLQSSPRLLLLHEPTQGVDIGARVQIFDTLRAQAEKGTAVLCASSDHEQLEQICTRVLVLGHGRVVRELSGADITKNRITEQCLRAESEAAGADESERSHGITAAR